MNNLLNRLLVSGSAVALVVAAATGAQAQTAPAGAATGPGGELETVVVSSTRITSSGFSAPTPTQVIGTADIEKASEDSLYSVVNQLPSLAGSVGLQSNNGNTSSGISGLSNLNIAGLGTIRTLTLLDGQRVIPANITGVVDISQLPSGLVSRVDVVTGGASASWGSDAVAGVVNFVTNKNFNGFKANVMGSETTYGDDQSGLVQVTAGSGFFGDKLHVEFNGDYNYEAGIGPDANCAATACNIGLNEYNGRKWYTNSSVTTAALTAVPAGQPQKVFGLYSQDFQFSRFGLITAGPLQGTSFNANGTTSPFQYGLGGNGLQGVASGAASGAVTNCVSPFCFGGDQTGDVGAGSSLVTALTRGDFYGRASYQLTPDINVYGTIIWSTVRTLNTPNPGAFKNANLTVNCGTAGTTTSANPFLPASIVAACAANKITTFQFGTANAQFPFDIAVKNLRDLRRYVLGADGAFSALGKDWTWSVFGQHGESDTSIHVTNISLTPRYNAAIDAAAGPGGTIVCRSAAAQADGCLPYNMFGNVQGQNAALAYMFPGTLGGAGVGPYSSSPERQEVLSGSLNGEPLSDWAGPVSVALGAEYREEAYSVVADPYGNGVSAQSPYSALYPASPLESTAGNNWYAGNFHDGQGNYHVSEGFLEFGVPLLKDDTLGAVNLDIGGRATGYSTSGYVQTWKVGTTWDTPIEGLRFRALQSRDVRAPNLSELFKAPQTINSTVINDFLVPQSSVTIISATTGNPGLKPEKSANTQLGFVYQPSWFPGFSASVDYYRLSIKGEIGTPSVQNEVDLCFQGFTATCSAISTVGNAPVQTGVFTAVTAETFNLASVVTDGFNIESSYQFAPGDIFAGLPGDITLHSYVSHVSKFLTNQGIPGTFVTETAGQNTGSIAEYKILGTESWSTDTWNFTLTENWISDGVINRSYIQCTSGCPLATVQFPTINNNFIPGAFYLAIGGGYHVTDELETYFKIDNALDTPPPPSPGTAPNNNHGINQSLFDGIGRFYHIGVRLKLDHLPWE